MSITEILSIIGFIGSLMAIAYSFAVRDSKLNYIEKDVNQLGIKTDARLSALQKEVSDLRGFLYERDKHT